jgi:phosphoglycerate dehydrogenase-like enzyme
MKVGGPYHIVVAEPFGPEAIFRLREFGQVELLEDSAPDKLLTAVSEADALLVRSRTHVTARIIDAATRLKVIGRASPTVDHIDLRAARRRNIHVVYAPRAGVSSTAEFALGLILTLHRRIPFLNRQLREGQFDALRQPFCRELRHLTLGLLGMDTVAETLGMMCSAAFELRVIYWDPAGATSAKFRAQAVDLDGLLAGADILSVHLPLSPQTRHLLNAERIAKLRPTAIVVNVSRGAVIDTAALAQALKDRTIAGAALDVFETEPLPVTHPLRRAPNCILTPHVAGLTLDAAAGRFDVAEDVIRVLHGQPPLYPFELPA